MPIQIVATPQIALERLVYLLLCIRKKKPPPMWQGLRMLFVAVLGERLSIEIVPAFQAVPLPGPGAVACPSRREFDGLRVSACGAARRLLPIQF